MDEADMLKNVVLHSVATALASRVFPVPYKDENINKEVPLLKKCVFETANLSIRLISGYLYAKTVRE